MKKNNRKKFTKEKKKGRKQENCEKQNKTRRRAWGQKTDWRSVQLGPDFFLVIPLIL